MTCGLNVAQISFENWQCEGGNTPFLRAEIVLYPHLKALPFVLIEVLVLERGVAPVVGLLGWVDGVFASVAPSCVLAHGIVTTIPRVVFVVVVIELVVLADAVVISP